MNTTVAWERTIRTGHPANDEQEVAACAAHAAAQGLVFERFPLPQGGVHVRASHPPAQMQPWQPAPQMQMQQMQPMQPAPAMQPAYAQPNPYAAPRAPVNVVAQPAPNAMVGGRCQGCGAHGETKNIVLVQNIGVILLRFQKILKGHFCKSCIRRHFWRMTTIMFFLGWWGLISFVFTCIGIPANIVQYTRTFGMKDAVKG